MTSDGSASSESMSSRERNNRPLSLRLSMSMIASVVLVLALGGKHVVNEGLGLITFLKILPFILPEALVLKRKVQGMLGWPGPFPVAEEVQYVQGPVRF